MANIDGDFGGGLKVIHTGTRIGLREGSFTNPQPPLKLYYKMRGQDVDCGPLTYRTWIVADQPDFLASQYSGPRCGVTPFSHVIVVEKWAIYG